MKFNKLLAGFLSVAVLSFSSVAAFAADTEDFTTPNDTKSITGIESPNENLKEEKRSYYSSVTGIVKEISDYRSVEGSKIILVEREEGGIANIILSAHTYVVNKADIALGSEITGFYEADAPRIMIYPDQYNAEVLVVGNLKENIKVDHFNTDLVSKDNTLKLNISDQTDMVFQNGTAFKGDLANRKLVVLYGASTRSIPAQTNPIKVVVLLERGIDTLYDFTIEEARALTREISSLDLLANKKEIHAPGAYLSEDGRVMVPLRVIVEALGYEVSWDNRTKSVRIGPGISLTIGQDHYLYMKMTPVQLGAAPTLVKSTTFVPLNFFKEISDLNVKVHPCKIELTSQEIGK